MIKGGLQNLPFAENQWISTLENDFAPSVSTIWKSTTIASDKVSTTIGEMFPVCRQVRRTYIDAVNAIFDFLAIPTKLVSESGIKRIHNS